jgi:uncharacterized protein (AIM24 family)
MASSMNELQLLTTGIHYSITDSSCPYVSLILTSSKSIQCSVDAVQWFSDGCRIQSKRGLFEIMLGYKSNLMVLINEASSPGYVGISKEIQGAIYAIQFDDRKECTYWIMKGGFLFADSLTKITQKTLPITRSNSVTPGFLNIVNDAYYCVAKKGFIFVQGGNDVVMKDLGIDDVIVINSCAILAIEASCTMMLMPFDPPFLAFTFMEAPAFLKIKGPGTVYISANTRRHPHSEQKSNIAFRATIALSISIIILLITMVILTKFTENLESLFGLDEDMLNTLNGNG